MLVPALGHFCVSVCAIARSVMPGSNTIPTAIFSSGFNMGAAYSSKFAVSHKNHVHQRLLLVSNKSPVTKTERMSTTFHLISSATGVAYGAEWIWLRRNPAVTRWANFCRACGAVGHGVSDRFARRARTGELRTDVVGPAETGPKTHPRVRQGARMGHPKSSYDIEPARTVQKKRRR
jgi:hypothetical protein